MTVGLWVLFALLMVAAFALGASTSSRWWDRLHRTQTILGVIFFAVGVIAVLDVAYLQHRFGEQVACNTALLHVLKTRSDARNEVDASTRAAQAAAMLAFDDLSDGKVDSAAVHDAHDAFAAAVEDRARLADLLAEPYPQC